MQVRFHSAPRATAGSGSGLRWCVAALLVLWLTAVAAAQSDPSEYEVKAGLMLVFLEYIEWPEGAFANEDSPIVVGILGDDPFGSVLERTFADQQVNGRTVQLRRSRHAEDFKRAHLVFVSRSERNRVAEVLAILDEGHAATLSEIRGFCRRGGLLNFYIEDKKVRFEANPSAAQRRSIGIGAQLLKRARIVGPPPAPARGESAQNSDRAQLAHAR